jgi:type IV pilus biogenesis protein PilP
VSDAPNMPSSQPIAPAEPVVTAVDETPKKSFFATTTGRVVIAVLALVLIVALFGGAFFMIVVPALQQVQQSAVTQTTSTTATSTSTPTTTVAAVEPVQQPLSVTFTFRNVFEPTVDMSAVSSNESTSSSSNTASSTPNVPANTLLLMSISSENGEPVAVFWWNGAEYTVGEGDTVDSSSWKVLEINSDSVLMLYGDTQITLSVGEGITK